MIIMITRCPRWRRVLRSPRMFALHYRYARERGISLPGAISLALHLTWKLVS